MNDEIMNSSVTSLKNKISDSDYDWKLWFGFIN